MNIKQYHAANHHRRAFSTAAFTLIELVLVMTIIIILVGSGIYIINQQGVLDTAQETRISGDTKAIATALEIYNSRAGRYPTTEQGIEALVEKPSKAPIPDSWTRSLDEVMLDPWGQPYKYRYPATKSKKPYDVYSIGKDAQENTADDLGNWKQTEAAK